MSHEATVFRISLPRGLTPDGGDVIWDLLLTKQVAMALPHYLEEVTALL